MASDNNFQNILEQGLQRLVETKKEIQGEQIIEKIPETSPESLNVVPESVPAASSLVKQPLVDVVVSEAQVQLKQVEKILEADLTDIYFSMTPQQQQEFKIKGEATAKEVNILLRETKIQVKKIIDLIKNWLKLLPGVNKFFLEKEAKIKADNLIKINSLK